MALEPNSVGDMPQVAPTAYIHPTATLIGPVTIESQVFIGPGAVIRADEPGEDGTIQPIFIGRGSNVQDNVIMHAFGGSGIRVDSSSSISHGAIVHGPVRLGKRCFVGFGSVVVSANLDDDVIVMHRSLVDGVDIPAGRLVPSMMAVASTKDVGHLKPPPGDIIALAEKIVRMNNYLAESGLRQQRG